MPAPRPEPLLAQQVGCRVWQRVRNGGWSTFVGLVAGVAVMPALSGPDLAMALSTVTMLVLAPAVEVLEGSLMKGNRCSAPTLSSVLDLCMEMDRAAYLGHACPVVLL